jgi:hypothetical protein
MIRMAKGVIRIKGGNFMEIVSDVPDFKVFLLDEDIKAIEPRYDEYKREREELFTRLKTGKYKYLIAVKEGFVRDSQVPCDEYVHKAIVDDDIDYNLPWYDLKGELILGVYEGNSEEEAIYEAAESINISRDILVAYPLA